MPQMSDKFVPKHKGDKNPNPKLLKFVRVKNTGGLLFSPENLQVKMKKVYLSGVCTMN